MKAIYKVTIRNHPDLTYHFLKRDDMEAFLDHVPDIPDGSKGYLLTVIPAYTTDEFSFAINDLARDFVGLSAKVPVA